MTMSKWHTCAQCGVTVKGSKYNITKNGRKPGSKVAHVLLNGLAGASPSAQKCGEVFGGSGGEPSEYDEGLFFCSENCLMAYVGEHKADFVKTGNGRKILKETERRKKAAIVSSIKLSDVKKKCLTLGFLGVHRFVVGKYLTGLLMPVLLILGIVMAIIKRDISMIAFSLIDIGWWIIDISKVFSKKFTDKKGNTICEG